MMTNIDEGNKIIYFIIRDETDDYAEKIAIPLNVDYDEIAVADAMEKIINCPEMSILEETYGVHDAGGEDPFEVAFHSYEITEWDDLKIEWELALVRLGLI
jgi:hypothetical protein